MKGKIDKDGVLYIERAGVMRQQMCPYSYSNQLPVFSATQCGDACPLFGEPTQLSHTPSGDTYGIKLCQRELVFGKLTDERKVQEKKEPEPKTPEQAEPIEAVEPVAVEGEYPETFF